MDARLKAGHDEAERTAPWRDEGDGEREAAIRRRCRLRHGGRLQPRLLPPLRQPSGGMAQNTNGLGGVGGDATQSFSGRRHGSCEAVVATTERTVGTWYLPFAYYPRTTEPSLVDEKQVARCNMLESDIPSQRPQHLRPVRRVRAAIIPHAVQGGRRSS
jgi:hypothetical protein